MSTTNSKLGRFCICMSTRVTNFIHSIVPWGRCITTMVSQICHGFGRPLGKSLFLVAWPIGAMAAPEPGTLNRVFHPAGFDFKIENDTWGSDPTDRHYTDGFRLAWRRKYSDRKSWFPLLVRDGECSLTSGFTFGQNMYTPTDIHDTAAQPDDRPYGAFMYIGAYQRLYFHKPGMALGAPETGHSCPENATESGEGRRSFSVPLPSRARLSTHVMAGWTGPAAFGEEMQTFVHAHISRAAPRPMGWRHQVPGEPALQLMNRVDWEMSRLGVDSASPRTRIFDALGDVNLDLGTIYDNVGAGIVLRAGFMDSYFTEFSEMYFTQGDAFWGSWLSNLRGYLFAEPKGLLVLRNSLIHCGFGSCDVAQEIRPWVFELQYGFRFSFFLFQVAKLEGGYDLAFRSSEYSRQAWQLAGHNYGSYHVGLSWMLRGD